MLIFWAKNLAGAKFYAFCNYAYILHRKRSPPIHLSCNPVGVDSLSITFVNIVFPVQFWCTNADMLICQHTKNIFFCWDTYAGIQKAEKRG